MLVLADLLAADELGLKLVAGGADALAREVAGAHSIDVEAPTRFLERRWLMLTAGLRLRGSAAAQRALIAELDEAGISALGIGLGLVFQRPPRALVEEARARSFPVLAVPLETAFRDITSFVARSSLSSDLHRYQRLTAIQRHLVDALREPDPRAAMVSRLARMLDAGAFVLDGPSAGTTPDPERVRRRVAEREFEEDGWHVVTVPIAEAGWLAVTARRRVPLARAAARPRRRCSPPPNAWRSWPATRSAPSARRCWTSCWSSRRARRRAAWPRAPPRSASRSRRASWWPTSPFRGSS
ncbi:PucR family transcriptional regulator ligand-binding domain-containing protein [Solirubrobacter phytolaccae]|uniref:PucR family transcriptional regulator ligand-binding domain-containing protein n=1 Tax=Solirubrobacter phytolaccae TaxID=1404360 RepID=A0A9X3S647_9ACTN|nr:PucR family transcriptional regulator ligand-binding domain-containing protein [Solirubrobacter phytolaccae]MDA0178668.1 PucR family transcriptional regulator ligand-binding domain-containing protein [Solirubrobacter phytolaccae]